MRNKTSTGDPIHDIAAVLDGPQTDNIVSRTRPQFGYIDIKGKIGNVSSALILDRTGYVVSGVSSDIPELADDETRVWFEPVNELSECIAGDNE